MPNHYGVLKVIPAKEIKNPGWFPNVATANSFARMFMAARAGDHSGSANWPKITKCFPRSTTIAVEAHSMGFEASITFDREGKTGEYSYVLHEQPQLLERGRVESVHMLKESPITELPYSLFESSALAAYSHRFIVFTQAHNDHRTKRLWLIGIDEFSSPEDKD